jgi:hypothetical protein
MHEQPDLQSPTRAEHTQFSRRESASGFVQAR